MHGIQATPNQVTDGEKGLKQKLGNGEPYKKKYFIMQSLLRAQCQIIKVSEFEGRRKDSPFVR